MRVQHVLACVGQMGKVVLREAMQSLCDFIVVALPVFIGICVVAGLLQWCGRLNG